MTHPHGLTKADVAHLKAGDEVTLTIAFGEKNERQATLTGELYKQYGEDALYFLDWFVIYSDGEPDRVLVEVVSPRPPVPPMTEPTWLGAVVMDGDGLVATRTDDAIQWFSGGAFLRWNELRNPRPLTPAERRNLGIPATLPEGWVAVDVSDVPKDVLSYWSKGSNEDSIVWFNRAMCRVARAELARREATA